jgi:ABC-type uncharacterized transport system ATPase subunit
VDDVLEAVGLADRAKEAVKGYSGGMKLRLNFGCGLVHQPKVLLLDEPTVGVDPQSRVHILDRVRELTRSGTCVLYTTHYMEADAQRVGPGAVEDGDPDEVVPGKLAAASGGLLATGTILMAWSAARLRSGFARG